MIRGPLPVLLLASTLAAAGQGEKILDLNSYWRSYYVLRPARTSPRLWRTVELPTEGRSGERWAAWDKAGREWDTLRPEHRHLWFQFCGHMETSPLVIMLNGPPAPDGWQGADFNDSLWPRTRYPLLMKAVGVDQAENWNAYQHGLAQGCFRGQFVVPEPSKAGALTLRVAYRGGVCVWLNGKEIGRGHLPAGPITADTVAEEYPEDAYTLPPGAGYTKGKRCVEDIGGDYRPETHGGADGYWRIPLSREDWDAVIRRRDRVLGPLAIPPASLRKGVNVLAIQVVRADLNPLIFMGTGRLGANTHYGWSALGGGASWSHSSLVDLELRASPAGGVQAEQRPRGIQVWADDPNRRLFNAEFGDAGHSPRVLRLVGARRGTYSAQLAVGTDRELGGLAAEAGDLAGPGGATIPASAVRITYGVGRSVRDLATLGSERNPREAREHPLRCPDTWMALWRFGRPSPDEPLPYRRFIPYRGLDGKTISEKVHEANRKAMEAAMARTRFFDELSPTPPAVVPANSCQSVFVSVRIPPKAAPGLYAGKLRIRAEARTTNALAEEDVPLRVQVVDWTLPDPAAGQDFTTMIAMEQSPWGVAKAHKVEPWSDEHFRRIEHSLQRMAELGNDWLMIPVLLNSEFGNREDSFVLWVKGRDGRLSCDFSRLDRYLDIALRRGPKPRIVCFCVAHPPENNLWVVPKVLLRDEATGKTEPFTVPLGEANPFRTKEVAFTDAQKAEAREFWRPFVEGVMKRMKARGLEQSVFWGYVWDYTLMVDRYKDIFAELAPGVKWARGSHGHGGVMGKQGLKEPFGCVGTIVTLPQPVREIRDNSRVNRQPTRYVLESHKGWKTEALSFSLPRVQNAVLCLEGSSVPFLWRLYPELAIVAGARGICRIGLDYWEGTCHDGWLGGCQVGLGVVTCIWPGQAETHTSARFEMLREGMQEAEARILLEQAIEGPLAGTPAAERLQKLLDDRILATLHIPRSFYVLRMAEQFPGWQERSWDLYAAAAEAAGGEPAAEGERSRFFGP
ncbi:MAG TPA: glycoside hydrolase domain-containing protein [Planctomycetota bacterium]|nr:glycoside hydrolase domain-containing protein [Planctomycetota bacterium]